MATPDEFFNQALDAFQQQRLPSYALFDLGLSPSLQLPLLPRANIYVHQSVIRKAAQKHGIDLSRLRNLPSLFNNPLQIFRSKTEPDSLVFQLALQREEEFIVAAMVHGLHPDLGPCHSVKSIHRRPIGQLARWALERLLLYQKNCQVPLEDSARCNCGQQPKEPGGA